MSAIDAFKSVARNNTVFGILKAIIVVACVVVVMTVFTPVLEVVLPNSTSVVPDAVLDDVQHMSTGIQEQAGRAVDMVATGVEGTISQVVP